MGLLAQIRLELRSLVELYLLPALAVPLPWPLAYRLLRWLARYPGLYEEEWRPALAQARRFVPIDDERDWAWRFRTTRLVDHADFWLSRTRSHRWARRHFDRNGDWPLTGTAAVGVFFHWCAGLWAVRDLRAHGPTSAVLARRPSARSMGGAWLGYWYGRMRLGELARISGRPLIYAPGTVQRARDDLAAGIWVIGTPDVPPTETRYGVPVTLFGQPAHFAEGLLLIARRAQVPIVVFTLALDFATGRRELRIHGPFAAEEPQLLQWVADYWQSLLREKSWGFTLWPMMPGYFAAPA